MTKMAFVFPGQGSQSIGMLSDLSSSYEEVEQVFGEASEAAGLDLWQLSQHGPADQLNQTQHTQPVLLAAGVAVWEVWQKLGGRLPDYLAGHSLGEYAALVASGVLSLSDATALVQARGQFMQDAVDLGQGSMAAIIGLADDVVETVCQQASEAGVVEPANYNSPGQIVIAGDKAAVVKASELAKAAGAKRALELAVSVPSHSSLMMSAAEKLAVKLEDIQFNEPTIPVIQNVDVNIHRQPDEIKTALIAQLHQPVRWTESVQKLAEYGVEQIFECGPGKVLSGLIKRIDRGLSVQALESSETLRSVVSDWT